MPNWCDNTLELRHDDPAMIKRAKEAFEAGRLLDEFIPVPQQLKDTRAGFYGKDTYEQELLEATEALNVKWFKHKNWWDFCVHEWGTKWDVGTEGYINAEDSNFLSLSFMSAWSPPVDAYKKLEDMGFEIWALYYESGMMFCGTYGQETDECFDIQGNSEWVKENVPQYLDEAFCISEQMAEWEEENREDEDVSN